MRLIAEGLWFRYRRSPVPVLRGAGLSLEEGECLALLGPSGVGKTTLAWILLGLLRPQAGEVRLEDNGTLLARPAARRRWSRLVQWVPQHPEACFDPRWTLARSLAEPLRLHGLQASPERVEEAARAAGLRPALLRRRPFEVSGGELQRAAIARALLLGPRFLIADEPTSMLDASIQAGIAALIRGLQERWQLGVLWITHDRALAARVADRVLLLDGGRIAAEGCTP
jgi:peptide/nickel transport system ATP-binding protein